MPGVVPGPQDRFESNCRGTNDCCIGRLQSCESNLLCLRSWYNISIQPGLLCYTYTLVLLLDFPSSQTHPLAGFFERL